MGLVGNVVLFDPILVGLFETVGAQLYQKLLITNYCRDVGEALTGLVAMHTVCPKSTNRFTNLKTKNDILYVLSDGEKLHFGK